MRSARTSPVARVSRWWVLSRGTVFIAIVGLGLATVQLLPPFQPRPAAATPHVDATLPAPTNLRLTGLNSTIRANWTPAGAGRVAFQLLSIWDGDTLMGEKVLGATATAADGNGLQPGHRYTVVVQSMDSGGNLSNPLGADGSTDRQSPMRNAVFFENFEDSQTGALNPDYFDVRYDVGETQPEGVDGKLGVFVSEHHFHTMITSGTGQAGITIRPRGTFDFTGRTGTFQFEVDLAGLQDIPGKWLEIHLSRHAPNNAQAFGITTNDEYQDDVSFTFFRPENARDVKAVQTAAISVNTANFRKTFLGRTNNFTPKNVRVPVVLKVSQTSAEMLVNGESVAKASGYSLPFTNGEWTIAHRAFYAPRSPSFPQFHQLLHWNTVQFDGPNGSFSPARKTYLAPGCQGTKSLFSFTCSVEARQLVNIKIPDQVGSAKTARVLFNPFRDGDRGAINVPATINGHAFTATSQPGIQQHWYDDDLAYADVPASWLQQGNNVVQVGRKVDQVEIEVAFNQPRVIGRPAVTPGPLLGVTNDLLLTGKPANANTVDLTTYLFSQGSDAPINYLVVNKTGAKTPWLSVVTPASGTINSIARGGSLVPITIRIDFTKTDQDPGDVAPGILMVSDQDQSHATHGLSMVHVAVGYDRTSPTYHYAITSYSPLITEFNKAAIPDYHGDGSPTSTHTPSSSPSQAGTPSAIGGIGSPSSKPRKHRRGLPRLTSNELVDWRTDLAAALLGVVAVVMLAAVARHRRRLTGRRSTPSSSHRGRW
jgi:hypothetical protein